MFFSRKLKSAPLSVDITFRQYSRHRGTQEHFHPQGPDALSPARRGGGQRLPGPLQHQHAHRQRVQLPACWTLSHRGGGGPGSVHGGQPADPGGANGLPAHIRR